MKLAGLAFIRLVLESAHLDAGPRGWAQERERERERAGLKTYDDVIKIPSNFRNRKFWVAVVNRFSMCEKNMFCAEETVGPTGIGTVIPRSWTFFLRHDKLN